MTTPLPDAGDGSAAPLHPAGLRAWLGPFAAVVCGPGLGQASATRELVVQILEAAECPLVLDADGLNVVAGTPALGRREAATIVTPHPGEMSRLLRTSTRTVQGDRVSAACRLAARDRVVAVLKGAGTVIASPDGRVAICPTGNPGMATGGMGDVLAGVLGGLLAQGLGSTDAAALGVYAHGAAGDRVAARIGRIGLLAGDLVAELPPTLESLRLAAERA
jgi:NAD(P)H-hydrate epimerase